MMSAYEINPCCEYLPWDSDFFGYRIARVIGHRLEPQRSKDVSEWCRNNKIDCIYFLADPDHDVTIREAEGNSFHLVDIRNELVFFHSKAENLIPNNLQVSPNHYSIRPGRIEDIPSLVAISRDAHKDTRFFYDQHFPDSRCSDLYETWIKNSFLGFADTVVVAEVNSQPIGYITCKRNPDNSSIGNIGLLGVDINARGLGIGPALVRYSLNWLHNHGVEEVRVTTQGRNFSAQRVYQRCSFVTHSLRFWYHKWFLKS